MVQHEGENMSIQLQVGKKYRNRKGEVVEITVSTPNEVYPFADSSERSFTPDGRVFYSEDDLIEEVEEVPQVEMSELQQQLTYLKSHVNNSLHGLRDYMVAIDDSRRNEIAHLTRQLDELTPKPVPSLILEAGKWYETKEGKVVYADDYSPYQTDHRPVRVIRNGLVYGWYN
jgi:hypothetical protein